MATQTLQDIFGAGATLTNGKVTIDLADLTAFGLNTTKPGAILRAIIKRVKTVYSTESTGYSDPTVGVTAPAFESTNTFATRGTETQVAVSLGLTFYEAYSNADDPDNTL